MALEVRAHRYLFPRQRKARPVLEEDDLFAELGRPGAEPQSHATTSSHPTEVESMPPFIYNALHDMESIWWLALFLVLAGLLIDTGLKEPIITEAQRDEQYQLAEDLFCDPEFRMATLFAGLSNQPTRLASLHPRITRICRMLETLRSGLLSTFYKVEEGLERSVPFSAARPVCYIFKKKFKEIASTLTGDSDIRITFDTLRTRSKDVLQEGDEKTQPTGVQTAATSEDSGEPRPTKRIKTNSKTPSSTRRQHVGPSRRSQRLRSKRITIHT